MDNKINKTELIFMILIVIIVVFFLSFFIFTSNKFEVTDEHSDSDNFKTALSFEEAILDGDISNCDYILEKNLIESCKLELVKCNDDDDCYFDKARYEKDTQLCFNIKDETKLAGCSASIKISEIRQRAVLEDNVEICTEFETDETINFCQDNFYIANRYNKNDLSFCDNILNEVIRNECLK